MFTGLVECTGKVLYLRRRSTGAALAFEAPLEGVVEGDSVAINGVCQTITGVEKGSFTCDVLGETLRVSNLGDLSPGDAVNLERALKPGDRMGGHIVNGHVDGTGIISRIKQRPIEIEISVAPELARYMVAKGSVAVDGISLTVGPDPGRDRFSVFVIPHTWKSTNLNGAAPGKKVNIEIDILAKYVEKLGRK